MFQINVQSASPQAIAILKACLIDPPLQANLGITISASPLNVLVGSNVVYTLVVNNAGPNAANGTTITDVDGHSLTD